MINENISQVNQDYDSYRERLTNFGSEFELGLFLFILRSNLKWLLLFVAIAFLSSFLYLRYTAPTYVASTVIQLSKSDNAMRILKVNQIYEEQNLSVELELLRSKLLIKNTVERLPLSISYFIQGEILNQELYRSPFPRLDLAVISDSSIINKEVFIRTNEQGVHQLFVNDAPYSEPFQSGDFIKTQHFSGNLFTRTPGSVSVTSSPEMSFRINNPASLVARFQGSVDVKVLHNVAQTILISCEDKNPLLAHDFVMAHAREYLKYDQDSRERSASSIIEFIDQQIEEVYGVLSDTEYALNEFLKDNKIANVSRLSDSYIGFFQSYDERIIEIEFQEKILSDISQVTTSNPSELDVYELIPVITGTNLESTALNNMIEDLRMLLITKEELRFQVTPDHGRVKNLEFQVEIQKKLIIEAVDALRNKLASQRDFVEDKLKDYEKSFYALPEKELEYARLQRHFKINEKYYTMLLEKQTEYRISKAGFVPENRILEEARVPQMPISPNRNMIYFFAFLATLFVSFLLILVKYITHNEITSLHEISKLSHASIGILGMTPKYSQGVPASQMVVDKNPKSLIAESFRTIRTNLQFIDDQQTAPRTIAITSTISGEGKTFIAINLAGIIAFSGKRVIILDMDMRKPKIHVGFGVPNTHGISTILVGKDSFKDCIHQSNLDNLDFITAGPVPPNPSELLLSKRTHEMIDELKSIYDVIMIDNPPVGMVTDGISIIQKADYPIYVFRADYSKKQFVQNVDRLINENGISKMTVILNGVDAERQRYGYNYGYGYGYGYGQAYGYYEKQDTAQKRWFEFWK